MRGLYNVQDFGAIGGNFSTMADDTIAIQAAIDACAAMGGGKIYLPNPGGDHRYWIDRPLDLHGSHMGFVGFQRKLVTVRANFGGGNILWCAPPEYPGSTRLSPSLVDGISGKRAVLNQNAYQHYRLTKWPQCRPHGLNTFTVSGWVKFNSTPHTAFLFTSCGPSLFSTDDISQTLLLGAFDLGGGDVRLFGHLKTTNGVVNALSLGSLASNIAYFVAMTYDGTHLDVYLGQAGGIAVRVIHEPLTGSVKGSVQDQVLLNANSPTNMGDQGTNGGVGFDEIDGFHFQNTVAFTGSSFTVPIVKPVLGTSTLALMTFEDNQRYRRFDGLQSASLAQGWTELTDLGTAFHLQGDVTISDLTIEQGVGGCTAIGIMQTSDSEFRRLILSAENGISVTEGNCFDSEWNDIVVNANQYGFFFAAGGPCKLSNLRCANAGGVFPLMLIGGGYALDDAFIGGLRDGGIGVYMNGCAIDATLLAISDEAAGAPRCMLGLVNMISASIKSLGVDCIETTAAQPVIVDGGQTIAFYEPNLVAPGNTSGGYIHAIAAPTSSFTVNNRRLDPASIPLIAPSPTPPTDAIPITTPDHIAGLIEVVMEDADKSISPSEWISSTILLSGNLTAIQKCIVPNQKGWSRTIVNNTSGGYPIKVTSEDIDSASVLIGYGKTAIVRTDDSGIVRVTADVAIRYWVPSMLTSLRGWYMGDIGYDDGGSGMWNDQSTAGNDLELAGTTEGPKIGDHTTIAFSGTDRARTAGFDLGSTNKISMFAVMKVSSAGASNYQMIASYGTGGGDQHEILTLLSTGADYSDSNGTELIGGVSLYDTWKRFGITEEGLDTLTMYLQNTVEGSIASPISVSDGLTLTVGQRWNDSLGATMNLAELVIFNEVLTEAELASLDSYFTDKYGHEVFN